MQRGCLSYSVLLFLANTACIVMTIVNAMPFDCPPEAPCPAAPPCKCAITPERKQTLTCPMETFPQLHDPANQTDLVRCELVIVNSNFSEIPPNAFASINRERLRIDRSNTNLANIAANAFNTGIRILIVQAPASLSHIENRAFPFRWSAEDYSWCTHRERCPEGVHFVLDLSQTSSVTLRPEIFIGAEAAHSFVLFGNVPSLTRGLFRHFTGLKQIADGAFEGLAGLETLDITTNTSKLSSKTFAGLSENLTSLHIGGPCSNVGRHRPCAQVLKIAKGTFGKLKGLTALSLTSVGLSKLPVSALSLPHLRVLNLWDNHFRNIPRSLQNLTSIQMIQFDGPLNMTNPIECNTELCWLISWKKLNKPIAAFRPEPFASIVLSASCVTLDSTDTQRDRSNSTTTNGNNANLRLSQRNDIWDYITKDPACAGKHPGINKTTKAPRQLKNNDPADPQSPNAPHPVARLLEQSCYFNDGRRLIDFVLAYHVISDGLRDIDFMWSMKAEIQQRYRDQFEQLLLKAGLEIEHDLPSASPDGRTGFIKIHAPWDFLAKAAEALKMKMPIAKDTETFEHGNRNPFLGACCRFIEKINPFKLSEAIDAPEPRFVKSRFRRSKILNFIEADPDHCRPGIFSRIQRIRLVENGLSHIAMKKISIDLVDIDPDNYSVTDLQMVCLKAPGAFQRALGNILPADKDSDDNSKNASLRIDLTWLLAQRVFTAAYPLHDSDYEYHAIQDPFCDKPQKIQPYRRWLRANWSTFRKCFKYQPIDHIRAYFGEQYALYFGWLGHYNQFLLIPSLLSIMCIIYGFSTYNDNETVIEICSRNDTICRPCSNHHCHFRQMTYYCNYARLSHIFDNESTVLFAIVLAIWSETLLQFWLRRQQLYASLWGCDQAELQETVPRQQFLEKATKKKYNPITRREEAMLPTVQKIFRRTTSFATVLFFFLLSIALVVSVTIYKVILYSVIAGAGHVQPGFLNDNLAVLIMLITSTCNSIAILILKAIYRRVAWRLTEFECLKTQKEFEKSFTYKLVSFQFINYYGNLFYTAFIKGHFVAPHKLPHYIDVCPPSGCMAEVCIHLMILMTAVPLMQNIVKFAQPLYAACCRKIRGSKKRSDSDAAEATQTIKPVNDLKVRRASVWDAWRGSKSSRPQPLAPRWQRDYALKPLEKTCLIDEYLELTIQYGLVTMFAAAFPLGALFALLNNIFELRFDAMKYVIEFRRPVPQHDGDLGPWLTIYRVINTMAVVTNGLLIITTSDIIDRFVYEYKRRCDSLKITYLSYIFMLFDCDDYPPSLGNKICFNSDYDDDYENNNEGPSLYDLNYDEQFQSLQPINLTTTTQMSTTTYPLVKIQHCLFRDYRIDYNDRLLEHEGFEKYALHPNYWQLMTVKLIWFIVFEHIIFIIQVLMRLAASKIKHQRPPLDADNPTTMQKQRGISESNSSQVPTVCSSQNFIVDFNDEISELSARPRPAARRYYGMQETL